MLRVSDNGGDRAVSDSVSGVWDQDRASGTVAEQGSLQQAIRRDGGASVRKRIGATSGTEILCGGEHGTSNGSAISGALDGGTAETGSAADGSGRDPSGQAAEVHHRGEQSGDGRAAMVRARTEKGDAG